MDTQTLSQHIEASTPDTAHGCKLVGWALYENDVQASLFARNAFQAAKWLMETPPKANRTTVPVYSDSWFYGTNEE